MNLSDSAMTDKEVHQHYRELYTEASEMVIGIYTEHRKKESVEDARKLTDAEVMRRVLGNVQSVLESEGAIFSQDCLDYVAGRIKSFREAL